MHNKEKSFLIRNRILICKDKLYQMKKLKNISRSLAKLLVKKLFMQKEIGVMKKYYSLIGQSKHIVKK